MLKKRISLVLFLMYIQYKYTFFLIIKQEEHSPAGIKNRKRFRAKKMGKKTFCKNFRLAVKLRIKGPVKNNLLILGKRYGDIVWGPFLFYDVSQ